MGLQFFFKAGTMICFALVVAVLRQQDKEASATAPGVAPASSPALQKKLLVSDLDRKREDSRV